MERRFVAYYRVSTQRQGASGLGLQAQQAAVANYLSGVGGHQVAEFEEIESGKGADALARRPQLRAALDVCKRSGACLLLAKLDRLALAVVEFFQICRCHLSIAQKKIGPLDRSEQNI